MKEMTLLENLSNVFNTLFSSTFLIALLITFVLVIALLVLFYLIKNKKSKIILYIVFILALVVIPCFYSKFFLQTFDTFFTEVVRAIYFPTYYVYIVMLILIYFNTYLVFRNKDKQKTTMSKVYGIIQIIYFVFYQILFFMIITIVIKDKVDVFDITSIYESEVLTSYVQISSYLFWIGFSVRILLAILGKLLGKSTADISVPEEKPKEKSIIKKPHINYYSNREHKPALFNNKKNKDTSSSYDHKNLDKILGINNYNEEKKESPIKVDKIDDSKKDSIDILSINTKMGPDIGDKEPDTGIKEFDNVLKEAIDKNKDNKKDIDIYSLDNGEEKKDFDDFFDQ